MQQRLHLIDSPEARAWEAASCYAEYANDEHRRANTFMVIGLALMLVAGFIGYLIGMAH